MILPCYCKPEAAGIRFSHKVTYLPNAEATLRGRFIVNTSLVFLFTPPMAQLHFA